MTKDPASYNIGLAVSMEMAFKLVKYGGVQAKEAAAFVKLGYEATDPSGVALSVPTNPKNVAANVTWKWKWVGLRDNF